MKIKKKERWIATPTLFYKTQNLCQHFLFNHARQNLNGTKILWTYIYT